MRKHKPETKAKIQGFLKNLRSYEMLVLGSYLDVLQKVSPASLVFEGNGLLASDVSATILRTKLELRDIGEIAGTEEELLNSHVSRFMYTENEDGEKKLQGTYIKHGDMLKNPGNRENVKINLEDFKYLNEESLRKAASKKKAVAEAVQATLTERFSNFDEDFFQNIEWIDPKNWIEGDRAYGNSMLEYLSEHFRIPLTEYAYDMNKTLHEWKRFKIFIKASYGAKLISGEIDCSTVWNKVFLFRQTEFPNICLLAEIVLVVSVSNSSVERSFSFLTLLLTDWHLKMKHSTTEMMTRIKGNDHIWNDADRDEIISDALDIFLRKQRKVTTDEPPVKRSRRDEDAHSIVEESDADSENDIDFYFESSDDE